MSRQGDDYVECKHLETKFHVYQLISQVTLYVVNCA